MKILLCLLSDQHVPNLLSVHHYQPEQLVFIETQSMRSRNVAQSFLKALELGGLKYHDRCHVERLDAEDSLSKARTALQRAFGRFPSGEWIANLTGGTKPMSIATHEFFKALGGKLVYTNVTMPSRIIDVESEQTEDCRYQFGIKEFLAGYGFESRKADDKISEGEERAQGWSRSAVLLAKHANDQDILKLDDEERNRGRNKGIELMAAQFQFPCDELRDIWLDGADRRKLSKYEVVFLTGGWLEVFFWGLLMRHSEALGIWDVRLGLEVGRLGDPSGNDFDVAFMHNYGLSMIECKTGPQSHDDGGDVLYKVEAVTRQFRALRARSYLATTAINVLDKKEEKVKESLRVRADIYQCRILIQNQIRSLASHTDDLEKVRSLIFGDIVRK